MREQQRILEKNRAERVRRVSEEPNLTDVESEGEDGGGENREVDVKRRRTSRNEEIVVIDVSIHYLLSEL